MSGIVLLVNSVVCCPPPHWPSKLTWWPYSIPVDWKVKMILEQAKLPGTYNPKSQHPKGHSAQHHHQQLLLTAKRKQWWRVWYLMNRH